MTNPQTMMKIASYLKDKPELRIVLNAFLDCAGKYKSQYNEYADLLPESSEIAEDDFIYILRELIEVIVVETIKNDTVQYIEVKTRFKEDHER